MASELTFGKRDVTAIISFCPLFARKRLGIGLFLFSRKSLTNASLGPTSLAVFFAHFFLGLRGFITFAFTLAVHGLPYPLLAIIGVFTVLARSHVGIRAGVNIKRPLRPSDSRRANLVALISASALSHE